MSKRLVCALFLLAAMAFGSALALAAPEPPVAEFTFSCHDLTCDFDASTAKNQGSNYIWLWGDGTHDEATEATISHTYQNGGIFTVRLTVGFDRIGFDSKSHAVTVSEPGS